MNCQEFDRCIQAFIEKRMGYNQLKPFLKHFQECEECRDELEINFLMNYVLNEEERSSFNLSDELGTHIQEALYGQKKYYRQTVIQSILFLITNVCAVVAMVNYILHFMR